MDDCVHTQQCAGKTKLEYEAFNEHKMAQENGLSSFSGQNVNKEDWAQDNLDSEQRTLKEGTNEGSLPAMSAQGKGRAKLNHKPKVNGSVARVIAKKYT